MKEDLLKFLKGAVIFVVVVLAFLWLLDWGPFEKRYDETLDFNRGSQPSFTGYSGPCHYVETYTGKKCTCTDWSVKGSEESGLCRCGHGPDQHW